MSNPKGELERRGVFLRLNRDNGLPRRAHSRGEARLGEVGAGQADALDVVGYTGFLTAHEPTPCKPKS